MSLNPKSFIFYFFKNNYKLIFKMNIIKGEKKKKTLGQDMLGIPRLGDKFYIRKGQFLFLIFTI